MMPFFCLINDLVQTDLNHCIFNLSKHQQRNHIFWQWFVSREAGKNMRAEESERHVMKGNSLVITAGGTDIVT